MADEPSQIPEGAGLSELAGAIADEQQRPERREKDERHVRNVALEQQKDRDKYALRTASEWFIETVARRIIEATSLPESALDPLARGALDSLLSAGEPSGRAGPNVGDRLLQRVAGSKTSIEPGTDGAARYLSLFLNESVEAWLRGVIVEFVTEYMPKVAGIGGGIETVQGLQDIIESALGGPRMVRRVLQPFLQATAITPAQWHVNKQFRPELLTATECARQVARGRMTREAAIEEMARQGWSNERAEALFNTAARFFSISDTHVAWRMGMWSREQAAQHIREQGYTLEQADQALQLETAKDVASFEQSLANAAVTAYADRRIGRAEFGEIVRSSLHDQQTAARLIELGETRRLLNRRSLSAGDARRLARAGILSVSDYRRALEDEGYEPFAVTALELELRQDLQEQRALEELRAEQEAERAAEKAQRDQERAQREAELAEKRARAFPALSEFKRAYIRGLIPVERYAAALAREKVAPEDADFLVADAELDREAFLEQEERRRQAEAAEVDVAVPLGVIEQSVLRGILTIQDYDADLERRGYDLGERQTFVNLLANRLEDQRHAEQERAAANARAQLAGVSIATWERAVRIGVRSRAQYAAFLNAIGTGEVAKALIVDLLDAQLAADDAARAKRDAAEAAAAEKGLSLEQRRRAVLMGVRDPQYYSDALLLSGLSADDQQVLMELLFLELDAAEAARQRRDEMAPALEDPELSLSQIERAVRLGLLPPDALFERARSRGFSAEDAELLVQLAILGIPDVKRGQAREQEVDAELRAKGISLADQKTLVKRGIRSLDDYTAFLEGQGYSGDDVALLRQLLAEEIDADVDGMRKRLAAKLAKVDGAPALADVEAALFAGELDALQMRDVLVSWDAGRDESLVFARLLLLFGPAGA